MGIPAAIPVSKETAEEIRVIQEAHRRCQSNHAQKRASPPTPAGPGQTAAEAGHMALVTATDGRRPAMDCSRQQSGVMAQAWPRDAGRPLHVPESPSHPNSCSLMPRASNSSGTTSLGCTCWSVEMMVH